MDENFKQSFLKNPKAVLGAAGIQVPQGTELTALEDTITCRHVILSDVKLPEQQIVSELPPHPGFYRAYAYAYQRALTDPGFNAKLRQDPTETFRDLGVSLPKDAEVQVVDATTQHLYFAIPLPPAVRMTATSLQFMAADSTLTAVNANVNVDANVQANVNADVNVNVGLQVNVAAAVAVIVAVLI
jgi:hypothetical protein